MRLAALARAGILATAASLLILTLWSAQPAAAAPGDPVADVLVPEPYPDQVSPSVAFDGHYLYYVEYGGSTLFRIDVPPAGAPVTATGHVGVPIAGAPSGIMTLSYDLGRDLFWAVSGDGRSIYRLSKTGTATLAFTIADADRPGFTGVGPFPNEMKIAYDGADDTIWYSPDAISRIWHYQTFADADGTAIMVPATPYIDVDIPPNDMSTECGGSQSSGVAVGGPHLFVTIAGCPYYFEYTKTGIKIAAYPIAAAGPTEEDAECDNVSYAVPVIWIRDGYDAHIRAFEAPSADACRYGGGGPGPATHFAVSAPSVATAGTSFSFTVTAQDAYGNRATGYAGTVHFTTSDTSSGRILPADSPLTNGEGSFQATLTRAGQQTLTASDAAVTGTASLTVTAGSPTTLTFSGPASSTAGQALSVTVGLQDAYGNGASGRAHFTSSDATATLPPDSNVSNGQGTFQATLTKAGAQTITAAVGALSATVSLTVNAGSPATLTFTGPASSTAGDALPVTVTIKDAYGNAASGRAHFTSSDPTATLPADSNITGGQGAFQATLTKAGAQTITATVNALGGTLNVAVRAAAAANLAVSAPTSVNAGAAFTVSTTLTDRFGNLATGYTGTVSFATSDPLSMPGDLPADYTFTSGDGGRHDFTTVKLRTATVPLLGTPKQTITVTDGGGLRGTTAPITVNAL